MPSACTDAGTKKEQAQGSMMEKSLDSITPLLLWTHHMSRSKACTPERPQISFPGFGVDWKECSRTCHTCRAPGSLPWAVMHLEKDQEGKNWRRAGWHRPAGQVCHQAHAGAWFWRMFISTTHVKRPWHQGALSPAWLLPALLSPSPWHRAPSSGPLVPLSFYFTQGVCLPFLQPRESSGCWNCKNCAWKKQVIVINESNQSKQKMRSPSWAGSQVSLTAIPSLP